MIDYNFNLGTVFACKKRFKYLLAKCICLFYCTLSSYFIYAMAQVTIPKNRNSSKIMSMKEIRIEIKYVIVNPDELIGECSSIFIKDGGN